MYFSSDSIPYRIGHDATSSPQAAQHDNARTKLGLTKAVTIELEVHIEAAGAEKPASGGAGTTRQVVDGKRESIGREVRKGRRDELQTTMEKSGRGS